MIRRAPGLLVLAVLVAALSTDDPAIAQPEPGPESEQCDAAAVVQFTDVVETDYAVANMLCMRTLGLPTRTGASPGHLRS
ncbi:MAG: hypothetical protein OXS29_20125 [bacterium]|nr:hypothetical protein [bacterium]MDE0288263.1 hypothetical protein [bacterium]MDE0439270.1 hypothetical protein [bacterium]